VNLVRIFARITLVDGEPVSREIEKVVLAQEDAKAAVESLKFPASLQVKSEEGVEAS
jgi:hypothetical protein